MHNLCLRTKLTELYLQSLRKFLVDWGQSSVNRSTTKSPLLVSSITAMSTNGVSVQRIYTLSVHVWLLPIKLRLYWKQRLQSKTCMRSMLIHISVDGTHMSNCGEVSTFRFP